MKPQSNRHVLPGMERTDDRTAFPAVEAGRDEEIGRLLPLLALGDYHTILLRDRAGNDGPLYGRRPDDYDEGTLLFRGPEVSRALVCEKNSAADRWLVVFRADGIDSPALHAVLDECTFFGYAPGEALHPSLRERRTVVRCLEDIRKELRRPSDPFRGILLARHLGCLLDYGRRYYERQFVTRCLANGELLRRYDLLLEAYVARGGMKRQGPPRTEACAEQLGLSPAYFTDLLAFETGRTPEAYVTLKRMEIAKRRLRRSRVPIGTIAEELGFPSPQCFCALFKKLNGLAPGDYRTLN
ncbi:helix-turn-helix transcriptional regulator [Gallalistipes aquisgranensis]|uniref:helix-turn-helix transcriptional regulator n=1 Tax=Gallalistipes aquisgranensis TaxID=2779358 RepID=UPI001CF816C4|nr:helix-turn-helix transcriptional regulator [Gallalistipes aquisgranensis]MBE5033439.1 helix-turn-helix transcriptional regulator [Gallalistipes aquisgranensis]